MKKNKIEKLMIILICFFAVSCSSVKKQNAYGIIGQMEESEKKLNEQDGQNKTNIEWGGWDKTSNRPIDYTNGIINIRIKPKLGSFCFYVINEDEKHIPVMSTTNEYVLSSFYLKAGKKVYKLNDDFTIKEQNVDF